MSGDRLVLPMNRDWSFALGHGGRSWRGEAPLAGSEPVDLPHCWNAFEGWDPGSYQRGFGCYWRTLEIEDWAWVPGFRWRLSVGGFWGSAEIFWNRRRLGKVEGASLGTWLDVSEVVSAGHHQIGIRLENKHKRSRLPGIKEPDFLLYGGLAGSMELVRVPEVHLRTRITQLEQRLATSAEAGATDRLTVRFRARNEGSTSRRLQTRWSLVDPAGDPLPGWSTVGTAPATTTRGSADAGRLTLQGPRLERWSPANPRLLELRGELIDEQGLVLDRQRLRFGARSVRWGETGFHLNGERLELRGANRHECHPGFGSAVPEALARRDVDELVALGCNLVRLSHYPQSPAFLDACDEKGLMVYAELASWKSVRGGRWLRRALDQWRGLITRDRNRPSVVIWGMGNESRSRRAYLQLADTARLLDGTRPVTYAENHLYRARRWRTTGLPAVWGVNYELDVLERAKAAATAGSVLVTECMNPCLEAHGFGEEPLAERQATVMERELPIIQAHDFVAGFLVWCFADYPTRYRDRTVRAAGLLDGMRQPRIGAWWMRARYATEPFVHLDGDWSEDGPRQRKLTVVSNQARVQVDCAGVQKEIDLSTAGAAWPVATFEMPFDNAPLMARVPGLASPVEARVDPWGRATALRLRARGRRLLPGDLGEVEVLVVDAEGRRVRDWQGRIQIESVDREVELRGLNALGEYLVQNGRGRIVVLRRRFDDTSELSANSTWTAVLEARHDDLAISQQRVEFVPPNRGTLQAS